MHIVCGNLSVWTIFAMLITQETHSIITKYTHRAINGYYCANGCIMNHTETEHQRCVAHCITSPSCWVLSYNVRGKYCLLGAEPCVVSAANSDFRVMIFRTLADVSDVSKSPCISWRWYDGTEYPSRTVEEFTPWHSAMARKQRGSEIHIATCSPSSGWIWLPSGGNMLTLYRDCDLLVVSESCSVAWMPHVASDPLPKGSVEGGYLGTVGITYFMRVLDDLEYRYGYYAPHTGLGYYRIVNQHKTTTRMEILIQLHLHAQR